MSLLPDDGVVIEVCVVCASWRANLNASNNAPFLSPRIDASPTRIPSGFLSVWMYWDVDSAIFQLPPHPRPCCRTVPPSRTPLFHRHRCVTDSIPGGADILNEAITDSLLQERYRRMLSVARRGTGDGNGNGDGNGDGSEERRPPA